jgi:F0F1-type ATP synthase assembly protein I
MNTHGHKESEAGNKPKRRHTGRPADVLAHVVRTLIGALIGTVLTSLFSIVIFAFVIKAFITSDEMSFQLLNNAVTLVGTALGAVLGYFLGRNSNDKPEQDS